MENDKKFKDHRYDPHRDFMTVFLYVAIIFCGIALIAYIFYEIAKAYS